MATINSVIAKVDELKPNAIEAKRKAEALTGLDGRIYEELTKTYAPSVLPPRSWPGDGDVDLLASGPYEEVYEWYLMAMVCFWQGEYAAYNNAAEMFGQAMDDFKWQYRRTHTPGPLYIHF